MAMHALVVGKPNGWDEAVHKAADWLWTQQTGFGCWLQPGVDPVYLTVLVLDAIELAGGGDCLTWKLLRANDVAVATEPSSVKSGLPAGNWSKRISKAAAARIIGISVDKIDDHLRKHPAAVRNIFRQIWEFDKNDQVFSHLP